MGGNELWKTRRTIHKSQQMNDVYLMEKTQHERWTARHILFVHSRMMKKFEFTLKLVRVIIKKTHRVQEKKTRIRINRSKIKHKLRPDQCEKKVEKRERKKNKNCFTKCRKLCIHDILVGKQSSLLFLFSYIWSNLENCPMV